MVLVVLEIKLLYLLGSNRSTAAGNRARIPGSKCVNSGNCNCAGCNDYPNYTNQGVPCCN